MEIERKYLVNEVPQGIYRNHSFSEITQGYICLNPEIRIRKQDDKYFITKKSEGTLRREEQEVEIDALTYEILLSGVKGNLVEKTRFNIPLEDNKTAELDIYHGKLGGIITVEIGFQSEEESKEFKKPIWFGKEITRDRNYKNRNLSLTENLSILMASPRKLTRKKGSK